jgi:hypothetical protein
MFIRSVTSPHWLIMHCYWSRALDGERAAGGERPSVGGERLSVGSSCLCESGACFAGFCIEADEEFSGEGDADDHFFFSLNTAATSS